MVKVKVRGNWSKSLRFLQRAAQYRLEQTLDKYGRQGVDALRESTPKDTGNTANHWSYIVSSDKSGAMITWTNDNFNKGVPIAIILNYGHGTGTGGYVQGREYISPAIRPVFDAIAENLSREVKSL